MGYLVYILRCGDGTLYTGCTNDLPRRLQAHQSGRGAKYTRSRLPVELVYQEAVPDRSAALRREAAIKRLDRRRKLALIAASDRGRRKNEQNVKCGKNADNPYTSGRKRAIIYKLNYAFFGGGSPPAERRRP